MNVQVHFNKSGVNKQGDYLHEQGWRVRQKEPPLQVKQGRARAA